MTSSDSHTATSTTTARTPASVSTLSPRATAAPRPSVWRGLLRGAAAGAAGVPLARLGTTDGATLTWPGEPPIVVAELKAAHDDFLPTLMRGEL